MDKTIWDGDMILGLACDVADDLVYNLKESLDEDSEDAGNLETLKQWLETIIRLRRLDEKTLVKVTWDYSRILELTIFKEVKE